MFGNIRKSTLSDSKLGRPTVRPEKRVNTSLLPPKRRNCVGPVKDVVMPRLFARKPVKCLSEPKKMYLQAGHCAR